MRHLLNDSTSELVGAHRRFLPPVPVRLDGLVRPVELWQDVELGHHQFVGERVERDRDFVVVQGLLVSSAPLLGATLGRTSIQVGCAAQRPCRLFASMTAQFTNYDSSAGSGFP